MKIFFALSLSFIILFDEKVNQIDLNKLCATNHSFIVKHCMYVIVTQ